MWLVGRGLTLGAVAGLDSTVPEADYQTIQVGLVVVKDGADAHHWVLVLVLPAYYVLLVAAEGAVPQSESVETGGYPKNRTPKEHKEITGELFSIS